MPGTDNNNGAGNGANGNNGTDPNADKGANNGAGNGTGDGGNGAGKNDNAAGTDFDTSKLSDEQLAKVYDDPRLFNHPRFKQLNERAKEGDRLKTEAEQRATEEAKAKGEWEKVAKQNETKANEAQAKYQSAVTDNAIIAAASSAGVQDVDAVVKLIDRSNVKLDDNGNLTGVTEAVKALLEAKPYLTSAKQQPRVGTGTAPAGGGNTQQFKASQISDPKFFKEHEADIMKAMAVPGAIVEDRPGRA